MDYLRKIKLIAFDLDGTLVDSAPDLAQAINAMLSDLARPQVAIDTIISWVGNGAEALIKRALSDSSEINHTLSNDVYLQARTRFFAHYSAQLCVKSCLYPQVRESLDALQAQGYKLALITNKPHRFTAPLLEALDLCAYFSLVLSGDSLDEKKPHPMPLMHALAHFNLSAEQMLMVGDSKNDILAAKAAGCPSLGLTYGYNYGEDIRHYQPELVSDSLSSLPSWFAQA